MSLRDLVVKEYQQTITNSLEIPRELKDALKVHERMPAFMDNLCKELSNPLFAKYSNNQLRGIVNDATMFFISLVKQKANEQMLSDLAKEKMLQEQRDKAIINKAADTGIVDEEVMDVLNRKAEKKQEAEANNGDS